MKSALVDVAREHGDIARDRCVTRHVSAGPISAERGRLRETVAVQIAFLPCSQENSSLLKESFFLCVVL